MKHLDIQKKYVWSNDDPIKTTNLRKINVSVEIQINRILNLYNKKAKKNVFKRKSGFSVNVIHTKSNMPSYNSSDFFQELSSNFLFSLYYFFSVYIHN